MPSLRAHIAERLRTKKFCNVFDNQLREVFPENRVEKDKRHRAITDFASKNGWAVTICDPGIRAIFKNA